MFWDGLHGKSSTDGMDGWKDGDMTRMLGGQTRVQFPFMLFVRELVFRLLRDLFSRTDPIWDECVSRAQTCRHRVARLSPS